MCVIWMVGVLRVRVLYPRLKLCGVQYCNACRIFSMWECTFDEIGTVLRP